MIMREMARITVSLPSELLAAVDQDLTQVDESRSAVVRRVLEEALRQARETKADDAYVRAYQKFPQTDDELGWSDLVTRERLSEEPW
jgi:metal-responsive CopG/Arc/MetJ family transcriptional regulator